MTKTLGEEVAELRANNAKLRDRLEISDECSVDGIESRDKTISILDKRVADLARLNNNHGQRVLELAANNARLRESVKKAYQLGQTYWSQADSESYSDNRKSVITEGIYKSLLSETPSESLAAIQADAIKEAADNCPFYTVQNEPAIMRSDLIEYADNLGVKE